MKLNPIELRHKLHQRPELSFREFETSKLLINCIKSLSSSPKIKIHTPYKTGLLVEYTVNQSDYLLFRADIDALPIKEENSVPFRSENEFMHACGHDVHTSILFGFLQKVLAGKVDRNILFLFQPAEESGGGAMEFYATNIFDRFKVSNAFALHVTDEYPEGTIASTSGVLFASSLEVNIDFTGVSAHVAFPTEGKNAFNALRTFLDYVERIPKDINQPLVFGAGKIYSGEVRNIVPGYARLEGTIRGLSGKYVAGFYNSFVKILGGIEKATGVNINIEKGSNYPEVVVNAALYEKLLPALSNKFKFIDCGYKMTGEDFGFISHKYPSFMFWLGTSNGEKHGLHNPKFLPRDEVIKIGQSVFEEILRQF